MVVLDDLGGLRAVILQRVDPLAAFILDRLRGVERVIRARQAAFHHLHVMQRHADLGGDHLAQLVPVERLAPRGIASRSSRPAPGAC
jgi:hypothetical protein